MRQHLGGMSHLVKENEFLRFDSATFDLFSISCYRRTVVRVMKKCSKAVYGESRSFRFASCMCIFYGVLLVGWFVFDRYQSIKV